MKKLGYLRVSTLDQNHHRQVEALKTVCTELHIEHASACAKKRPIYDHVIDQLEEGDGLVVLDLDRAWRSVVDALLEVEKLKQRGIHLEILNLKIDIDSPGGRLIYTVMGAFSAFERDMACQRTREGLAAAKARGVRLGRPPKLSRDQLEDALARVRAGTPLATVAQAFDMAPWSLSRALKRRKML